MTARYRVMSNGALVFPRRGKEPPLINGYIRDPGDPYILLPDFKESCDYRSFGLIVLPCKKEVMGYACKYYNTPIDAVACNICCIEPKRNVN
jgi:hypothetical protein